MVGGTVVAVIEQPTRIYVNCRGRGSERRDTCAIYVQRNVDSEQIVPGDSLWWQGRSAFWTPFSRQFSDRPIPRLSYSGVRSPYASKETL